MIPSCCFKRRRNRLYRGSRRGKKSLQAIDAFNDSPFLQDDQKEKQGKRILVKETEGKFVSFVSSFQYIEGNKLNTNRLNPTGLNIWTEKYFLSRSDLNTYFNFEVISLLGMINGSRHQKNQITYLVFVVFYERWSLLMHLLWSCP